MRGHTRDRQRLAMLQRNLLYTAVARAKQIVVLVDSKRALAKAVRTQGAGRRYTALTERLQQGRARTVAAINPPWGRPAATGSGPARGADPRSGQASRTVRVTPRSHRLPILESQTE
jgi:hypothetical protein